MIWKKRRISRSGIQCNPSYTILISAYHNFCVQQSRQSNEHLVVSYLRFMLVGDLLYDCLESMSYSTLVCCQSLHDYHAMIGSRNCCLTASFLLVLPAHLSNFWHCSMLVFVDCRRYEEVTDLPEPKVSHALLGCSGMMSVPCF